MMDQDNIIEFSNVSFKYQSDSAFTLNDVSFNIPRGQWTSIVGHNGSGKSTVTKLMVGIENCDEGHIILNNQGVTKETITQVRRQIGIVFQNPDNQFVGSTVKYDVAFGLENLSIPYNEMHEKVDKVLKQVDMFDLADYEPHSLSGGQKQRVAIASVLALNPSIIILDEATSMLDPVAKKSLLDLVRALQREQHITIISITHDLSETMSADNIIVMNQGKVYKQGKPNDIYDDIVNLNKIGLELPFSMKMNQLLTGKSTFVTYEGLVDLL
ncbi:energy-coupling factor transporter ATPase [Staphylococcus pasteuri]|uniref:energy-coupling factor transporter ATPase n=1 Tax=Staphylococcus TaxID=1279 RepID=UPI00048A80E8|nr:MULTISPECIES: energy-coupling factor transporter ATPase [Staphylococcus]MBL3399397.1 energy-coupling factor transporter ATPase [Staphylococcus pasteuri]MCD9066960.1 energy-coupling factor transporter ATPase [Staphylococcus pasteuri]MCE3023010.1 energy-coupling factor transporter ATPase [Staphylococcus pasteuri]RFD66475.1 energy-coupling factor transporter ATPase [Staphylococcus pasteuri]RNM17987.1 energy-coupling factor transporter ATPase [Staphylococcus pasteuri]